jgi:hypothetical protein
MLDEKGRDKMKYRFALVPLGICLCLFCFGCGQQDRYDITGIWHFYEVREPANYFDYTYKFVGSGREGQLDFSSVSGVSGEYTVDADRVSFRVTAGRGITWNINEYSGVFITSDLMKGTLKGEHIDSGVVTLTWNGVWNARRVEGRAHRVVF